MSCLGYFFGILNFFWRRGTKFSWQFFEWEVNHTRYGYANAKPLEMGKKTTKDKKSIIIFIIILIMTITMTTIAITITITIMIMIIIMIMIQ